MRQNEKALLLVLISLLSLNRLCRKRAPEHIIVQSSPKPTIFFLWEILPRTSKCPVTPLFFIIFASKYATVHFASNKSKYVFHD